MGLITADEFRYRRLLRVKLADMSELDTKWLMRQMAIRVMRYEQPQRPRTADGNLTER